MGRRLTVEAILVQEENGRWRAEVLADRTTAAFGKTPLSAWAALRMLLGGVEPRAAHVETRSELSAALLLRDALSACAEEISHAHLGHIIRVDRRDGKIVAMRCQECDRALSAEEMQILRRAVEGEG